MPVSTRMLPNFTIAFPKLSKKSAWLFASVSPYARVAKSLEDAWSDTSNPIFAAKFMYYSTPNVTSVVVSNEYRRLKSPRVQHFVFSFVT